MNIVAFLTKYYCHAFIAEFILLSLASGYVFVGNVKNKGNISKEALRSFVENYDFHRNMLQIIAVATFAPVTLPVTLLGATYAFFFALGAMIQ